MIPGQTCANCAAFSAMDKQCRRLPPRAFILNTNHGQQSVAAFPPVEKDHWCLEWRQETKLQ